MNKALASSLILLLISACASHAPHLIQPANPSSDAVFIDANAFNYLNAIPGPPAPQSKAEKLDFKTLEKFQHQRTAEECARATSEANFGGSFLTFFETPRGPLSKTQVEAWNPLFDRVLKTVHPIWKASKEHWKRPRPYLVDHKLHPCVPLEASFAYPSGHAGMAELYGRILSDLAPDLREALMIRAQQIGEDRLIGGVHHPSDVRDGRVLADRIYEALHAQADFIDALNLAK